MSSEGHAEKALRDRVAELLCSLACDESVAVELREQAVRCLEDMDASARSGQPPCGAADPVVDRMAKVRLAACEGALSQLEQVFDSMADAVCVVDVNEEIFKVNERFAQLVGAERPALIGGACSATLAERCCDKSACALESIRRGEPLVEREVQFRNTAGATRTYLLTARPFLGPGGELVGAILSFRDIHDFKRLEQCLTDTRRMESLGHLAEGLAHEINTPCQFLGSNLEFLEGACADLLRCCRRVGAAHQDLDLDFLSEEIPAAVSQSRAGVERIARIVKAMRGFSAPPTTTTVATDLRTLVEDAITLGTPLWQPWATVELHASTDRPMVPVYASELSQALLALLQNAAEAIARRGGGLGHIDIFIRTVPGHLELHIEDDGDGIPNLNVSKVFDMFFTTKTVGEGMGLGLALVHSVVVGRHGGHVSHAPRPGGGTVFVVSLPLA